MSTKYIEHNKAFQLNKVRRLIKTLGRTFVFQHPVLDEFKEPTGDTASVKVAGVFHETTTHVSRDSTESTTTRTKPAPMILVLAQDKDKIAVADTVTVGNKTYKVNEVKNVAEGDFAADVSLEEVLDDGKRFSS